MTTAECLFDTNAIVKRYHPEEGSEIVDYLFDKSPRITINLTTPQVVEVLSVFYKLRADGKITEDERVTATDTFLKDISLGKIYLYDFAKRHLTDTDIYKPIAEFKPIKFTYIDKKTGKKRTGKKFRPNTADSLMLLIMREIKIHIETAGDEAYLVTSDEPVIKIAEGLKIKVINPEKTSKSKLPRTLDIREHIRRPLNAKAVFHDLETKQPLGHSTSEDISEMGLKVRNLPGLTQDRMVNFRLERSNKTIRETWGEVKWQSPRYCGLRLAEFIPAEHLDLIAK